MGGIFLKNKFGLYFFSVLPLVEQKLIHMANNTLSPVKFNGELLSKLVLEKRKKEGNGQLLSLEKTSKIVSCARLTIDRASKGNEVDSVTLYLLCKWLNKPMDIFFTKVKKVKQ